MNTTQSIVFLRGAKTVLRPIEISDVPLLTKWINDPDVRMYLQTNKPMSEIAERKWVESLADGKGGITLLITTYTGVPIGVMGLHDINHIDGTATTGAMIGEKRYWGKGYGSDAKRALLAYAFETLNLRKICSRVYAFNTRSIAYSRKCGYVDDGVQHKHVFRNGEYHDVVQLAIFKDEWLKMRQRARTSRRSR